MSAQMNFNFRDRSHPSHRIHEHSKISYHEFKESGQRGEREIEVLDALEDLGTATERQVAFRLQYADMNCVRPTIHRLIKEGKLVEVDRVKCGVTGKTVRRVRINGGGK